MQAVATEEELQLIDRKKQAVILQSYMLVGYSHVSGVPVSGEVAILALHEEFIPVLHCQDTQVTEGAVATHSGAGLASESVQALTQSSVFTK